MKLGGHPINENWKNTLLELLRLPTAPSREGAVADWLTAWAEQRGLECKADRWGNLLVSYSRGKPSGRPVAFAAHMDHPGFVAGEMEGPRLLRARWLGGVPPEFFLGAGVRFAVGARWVRGKVAEIETCQGGQRVSSALVEVSKPVAPGSAGMWDFPNPQVRSSRVYARGHDDIAGVAAIVCALDEAVSRRVGGAALALFTRCEEAGLLGAIAACKSRTLPKRSVVVALEASRAFSYAPLGEGAVVRVGDRMTTFTPWVTDMLTEQAAQLEKGGGDFRWQRKLMDGGTCESSVYAAYGYDAGALCLPLGNYHNVDRERNALGPEFIDMGDFASLVRLLLALVRRGAERREPREEWERAFQEKGWLLEAKQDA